MAEIIPVITIDGPSGVGKGTLCRKIAEVLQWNLLDSGTIYRMLALAVLYYRININMEEEILTLISYLNLDLRYTNKTPKTILNYKNFSRKIQSQEVANIASRIAVFPCVRSALLHFQRSFSKFPGLIADGRDMGTIVFPNAPVKIFLDASLEARTYRRMLQLQKKGFNISFDRLVLEIQERDDRDRNRTISSLVPAKDAMVLDSTNLTIEQLIKKVLHYAAKKLSCIRKRQNSIDSFVLKRTRADTCNNSICD